MQILIADDCNITWDEKLDFFMYGGIIVDESELRILAEQLLTIKKVAEIPKERPLKWTNNKWHSEPPINIELHARLKNQILDFVASSSCKIIVCLSPQSFYHKSKGGEENSRMGIDPETQKRTQCYALNDTLEKFQLYLEEIKDTGMVFVDKFGTSIKEHMNTHCSNLFPKIEHPNIVHPIIQIDNEESYLHQINDVVLGAVYFSLREMEYNFLPIIKDNFWMETKNDYASILGRGFNIYPLIAKAMYINQAKKNLESKFIRLINRV